MSAMQTDMSGLFTEGIKSFDSAMKAGLKIQEDLTKVWTYAVKSVGNFQDLDRRSNFINKSALPAAQKAVEECLKLMEVNAKSCIDLARRAAAIQPPEDMAQARTRANELWESTLAAMRANCQALVEANSKIMAICEDMGKKSVEEVARPAARATK
jgi:hypothetical protein